MEVECIGGSGSDSSASITEKSLGLRTKGFSSWNNTDYVNLTSRYIIYIKK